MSQILRRRLEATARTLKKPKNWIITQALEEYLQDLHRTALVAEARRQSMLASAESRDDGQFWEKQADTAGWQ